MADKVIDRARSLLGVSFRLHGRDPETGLDCVGLVSRACRLKAGVPTGYALRGGDAELYGAIIGRLRLTRRRGAFRAGDVLLMMAGPQQFHLGVWTGGSLIHADATLRRVVELPGAPPWRVIGAWHGRERKG